MKLFSEIERIVVDNIAVARAAAVLFLPSKLFLHSYF
jgi:hypothetical protein